MKTGKEANGTRAAADGRVRYRASAADVWSDEAGQDMIEYALVTALLGLGAIASLKGLSGKLSTAFGNIGTALTSNT